MAPVASQADQGTDRLERFRALRARLDPTGDPAHALSEGLYVEAGQAVSARLAAELLLAPASTHLLIGGVGSGKTTELMSAQRRLNEVQDTRAFYVDVSKQHDINKMAPGAIIVQAGLALAEGFLSEAGPQHDRKAIEKSHGLLRDLAHGCFAEYADPGDHVPDEWVPGILVPPDPLKPDVENVRSHTEPIVEGMHQAWQHLVVLLDGLDRMTDIPAFEQVIEHDVKALSSLGAGVVLVGPLKALYGIERAVDQHFDQFHYHPWVDPADALGADSFLTSVLKKRMGSAIDAGELEDLVRKSGGVLRDLLSLAQSACVEAYMRGDDTIDVFDVASAVDSFGRKHMQGLRSAEIEVLQRVLAKGTFVQTSEDDLALLMTRRVLEYRSNGRPRYAVHPTIAPFLKEMADKGQ
jgi:hypothetical protein